MRTVRNLSFAALVVVALTFPASGVVRADAWCDWIGPNPGAFQTGGPFSCSVAEDSCELYENNSNACRNLCIQQCGSAPNPSLYRCEMDPDPCVTQTYLTVSCICALDVTSH